jgi:hypothetical protein
MRGWKIIAAVIGVIVAFFVVSAVAHLIIGLIIDVVIAALVAGGIYVAIKMARSGKQVPGRRRDSEIRDEDVYSRRLPRADVDQYSAPAPPPSSARQSTQDIDDELSRLKREMGS